MNGDGQNGNPLEEREGKFCIFTQYLLYATFSYSRKSNILMVWRFIYVFHLSVLFEWIWSYEKHCFHLFSTIVTMNYLLLYNLFGEITFKYWFQVSNIFFNLKILFIHVTDCYLVICVSSFFSSIFNCHFVIFVRMNALD